jgi:hypothetical protein
VNREREKKEIGQSRPAKNTIGRKQEVEGKRHEERGIMEDGQRSRGAKGGPTRRPET